MIKRVINYLLRPIREQRRLVKWASTITLNKSERRRIIADYKTLYKTKAFVQTSIMSLNSRSAMKNFVVLSWV